MLGEHSAENKVVGSLLLVGAKDEKAAVLLDGHLLEGTNIFKGVDVMGLSHEELGHVVTSQGMEVLDQVRDHLARFVSFYQNTFFVVFDKFGFAIFQNFATFMSLLFLDDTQRLSFETHFFGTLDLTISGCGVEH